METGEKWRIIEKYLPNYYEREDVTESDIIERFVGGEELEESDMAYMRSCFGSDKEKAKSYMEELDNRMFTEAAENSLSVLPYRIAKLISVMKDCIMVGFSSQELDNRITEFKNDYKKLAEWKQGNRSL